MMFEGSKHVPGNSHIRFLEAAGASDLNGTTDFDRTNYFETLPSNQLELALWLESDRMGYLPDKLDQASLTNQQDVVRNERRQSIENSPYGIVEEGVFHLLFPKSHPYHADVMGSHADIQAAKLEDVRNFFKLYYAPNNASLAIVGDFDPAQAKQLVEKYFGPLKRGAPVPKIAAVTPPITAERRAVIHDQVELPRVYMAWLTSPIFKPGDADADLASEILGGGKSSRLYKKLVYEKQIALDVSASQQSLVLGSVFEIVVTARPGHTAEEMEKAVDEELAAFRKNGPTAVELERARNGIETGMIQGLERLGGFGGVADRLNEYNHYLGNPGYFPQDVHRYQSATTDSIRAFAEAQLKPTARVVVYGIPGKPDLGPDVPTPKNLQKGQSTGGESVNADAAWRENPPKPGPAHALNLPVPDIFKLSNGLTVYYHYRAGLPVVAANLVFNTGSGANPVDKPGLASFTANMLQQGTANAERHADCRRSGAAGYGAFFRREHGFVQRRREFADQEFSRSARSDFGHRFASDVSAGRSGAASRIAPRRVHGRALRSGDDRRPHRSVRALRAAQSLRVRQFGYGTVDQGNDARGHDEFLEGQLRAEQRGAGRLRKYSCRRLESTGREQVWRVEERRI